MQKAVKEKRDSFKKWHSSRTTEELADYIENKTNAKKAATAAKDTRNCIQKSRVEKDKIWYTNRRKLDTGKRLIRKILCI